MSVATANGNQVAIVQAVSALGVAEAFAEHAAAGTTTYVEANSTAPTIKHQIQRLIARHEVEVVDAVLTRGGIQLDGHRIPITLAGADAERVTSVLRGWGLVAETVSSEVGHAAAMQMLRGVVIKASKRSRSRRRPRPGRSGSRMRCCPRSPRRSIASRFVSSSRCWCGSHTMHCGRRSVEVPMIRETVELTGLDPVMSSAMQQLFERSVEVELLGGGDTPDGLAASADLLVDKLMTGAPDRATR